MQNIKRFILSSRLNGRVFFLLIAPAEEGAEGPESCRLPPFPLPKGRKERILRSSVAGRISLMPSETEGRSKTFVRPAIPGPVRQGRTTMPAEGPAIESSVCGHFFNPVPEM
ncbi:MAG: hypothetical protein C6P37_08780 [Caldibacillus debilis]|uniref:Uncharacterized protein n=1 Tax=Caldibacillus debilis TaxID=301148 RepID=A0A3E0K4M3_9BACI|nr:MAG: hypothetical protein C6P37_08780 [Caldibacillus debilis]